MKRLLLGTLLALTPLAHALDVGDITVSIPSKDNGVAKEIRNPTQYARLVTVKTVRITSPMDDGEIMASAPRGDVMSTPASLIMQGESTENVRFFYNGPADDQERYYRIQWTDEPISEHEATSASKSGMAMTSAVINTILVVAPRKEKFDYEHDRGTVRNTGNVSFRIISYGPCRDKSKDTEGKGCRERYYVMPGKSVRPVHVDVDDAKGHIGIWHGKRFITLK